jgi:hypothetical protein
MYTSMYVCCFCCYFTPTYADVHSDTAWIGGSARGLNGCLSMVQWMETSTSQPGVNCDAPACVEPPPPQPLFAMVNDDTPPGLYHHHHHHHHQQQLARVHSIHTSLVARAANSMEWWSFFRGNQTQKVSPPPPLIHHHHHHRRVPSLYRTIPWPIPCRYKLSQ